MSKFLISVLVCTLLSCSTEKVVFLSPQPDNLSNKNNFKNAYLGTYSYDTRNGFFLSLDEKLNAFNNGFLTPLGENTITIQKMSVLTYIKGDENTLIQLNDSSFINAITKSYFLDSVIAIYFHQPTFNYEYRLVNSDTIITNFSIVDTIFNLSNDHCKLRQYQNKLYLNVLNDSTGYWSVYQMYLDSQNVLWINSISKNDKIIITRLMNVNNEKIDDNALNPTRKTFKRFLQLGGFENKKNFKKE